MGLADADQGLDFWSFVEAAQARIPSKLPDADMAANRLVLSLNRAASLVAYDLESSVHRGRGLSWAGFRLLFTLWVAGPLSPNAAAALSGMTRAGVSNLSHPLLHRGLVEKAADPSDGRAVTLSLTAAGEAYVTEVFAEQNQRESRWASLLTPAEREILAMLLDKIMVGRGAIDAATRH